MKTHRLIWTLGWITMSSLAALQGCGDDEDDDGGGGKGGTSGAAGEAGDGGTSGSAGTGATGGTAGGGRGGTGGQTGGTGGSVSGAGGAPGGAGGEGGNGEGGAGPDRVQACTDYCQGYNDKDCEEAAANTYDDEADCRDVCNASSWELGDPGDASGNSIHCRLTHTGLAAAPNPGPDEVHCGHASENSTGQCVD